MTTNMADTMLLEERIIKIEEDVIMDEGGSHSTQYPVKEEKYYEGDHSSHCPVKEEKYDYGDVADTFAVHQRNEEGDEDEVPPAAVVILHPIKKEEDEEDVLAEDPLQIFDREDQSVEETLHIEATGSGGARTRKRSFNCNVCGKSFAESSTLSTHMRAHTGERLCKCDTCGTSFARKCHLSNHMRMHKGERPFKCYTCGKSFKLKGAFNTHVQKHAQEARTDVS